MDSKYILVKTTFEDREEAKTMAMKLVDKRLIASAQLSNIHAFYIWKGKNESADEIELTCITSSELYQSVENYILENHSYETPQIISIPILAAYSQFASWIDGSVR